MVALSLFSLLIAINGLTLRERLVESGVSVLDGLVSVLTLAFYVLLTIAYLRRTRTTTTDRTWNAWLVAFLGTGAPFTIPLLAERPMDDGALTKIAALILIGGLALMLWCLFHLSTNISVVPQARELVTSGPYRWARHPLYAAEIVNVVGICLSFSGVWPWVVLIALVLMQFLRARNEERLLEREVPGYHEYRASTPMLLPLRRPRS